jgi:4-carboxymuconolactone decarboxylase
VPFVLADGSLAGPFGPMTLAAAVGDSVQALGAALRFATGLSDATREAAILLIAAHHRSEFEWLTHAPRSVSGRNHRVGSAALHEGDISDA